jgi:hypothetical protein
MFEYSTDRTSVAIHGIDGSHDAASIEEVTRQLGIARASMAPEVATKPRDSTGNALAVNHPSFQVTRRQDGEVVVWLRHQGLGWFAFNFGAERALRLGQQISNMANRNLE